ncbi:flagellar biosynthetic protein FliR [Polycladidibacter hongkongensis]|uniref:flagellar biosynthetic protein FliR n=1 Tax=Polycladidibacter hongkongensis TaxID=1647556 RepID=UPI00082A2BEF|nr:flagellar biosynthetic protein FliR [Pseudovibrio hongkongensis]
MEIDLSFLSAFTAVFFLVFARVGTMIMLVPVFGERAIPVRIRLIVALMLCYVLYPLVQPLYPLGELQQLPVLLRYLFLELVLGFFVGLGMRLIAYALQTAGAIIANQSGLAFAMGGDMTNFGEQGAMVGSFLAMLGTTLVLATNLHYVIIAGIHDSFTLFPPGRILPVGDMAHMAVDTVSHVFVIAAHIGAPFILFGLVFYFGLGLLNKLMPQLQIFFVAMPVAILAGFTLLMLLLSTLMGWYLQQYEAVLSPFLAN